MWDEVTKPLGGARERIENLVNSSLLFLTINVFKELSVSVWAFLYKYLGVFLLGLTARCTEHQWSWQQLLCWTLISIMKIKIEETDIPAPPSILDLDQSKEDDAPQEVCCSWYLVLRNFKLINLYKEIHHLWGFKWPNTSDRKFKCTSS